jgi:hypothetical protein
MPDWLVSVLQMLKLFVSGTPHLAVVSENFADIRQGSLLVCAWELICTLTCDFVAWKRGLPTPIKACVLGAITLVDVLEEV